MMSPLLHLKPPLGASVYGHRLSMHGHPFTSRSKVTVSVLGLAQLGSR